MRKGTRTGNPEPGDLGSGTSWTSWGKEELKDGATCGRRGAHGLRGAAGVEVKVGCS